MRNERVPPQESAVIRPAVWAVFPWIVGILVGLTWRGSPGAAAVASVLAGFATALAWRYERRGAAFALLLIAVGSLGLLRSAVRLARQPDAALLAPFAHSRVDLVGRVTTEPRISGRKWRFGVEAETLLGDSLAAVGNIPVYAQLDTSLGAPRIGERVALVGLLRALPRRSTPGLFDYGAYLRRRGYLARLSVHDAKGFRVVSHRRTAWERFWDSARSYVRRAITRGLAPTEAGLVTGLVLGDRSGLPREVLKQFQACGVVHILAVSGLHVGIILLGVGWPLRRLFGRKAWHVPVLVSLVWAYAALTGGSPSVVRAAIMATVFLGALLIERRPDSWNALAVSALVTLLLVPTAIFEIGFQLSYAAVIGILWTGQAMQRRANRIRFFRSSPLGRFAVGLVVMTIGAQVTTWPLIAHYFARIPLFGVLVNPPIVALVTFAVWGAMGSLLVGWWPLLSRIIAVPVSWLLTGILRLSDTVGSWPGAAFWVRPPGWVEIALYAAIILFVGMVYRRRGLLSASVSAVLLLANLLVWSAYFHRRTEAEFAFLDVGQGDATLCTFPNGATLLVDGGPASRWYDAGSWTVVPYLRARGIRRVDVVIATHADGDHIGGLVSVLRSVKVGALWYNGRDDTTRLFRRLMAAARDRAIPVRRVATGDTLAGLGGVRALVLGPPRGRFARTWWPDNDLSVVMRMETWGRSVLLTGDAGFLAEGRLVREWGGELRSEVLKVGHHGSKYSTSEKFLGAVAPRWGVVSVGRRNRYGHPAPALLERLRARGVSVLRTDRLGTVVRHVAPDTAYWSLSLPLQEKGRRRGVRRVTAPARR